MSVAAGILIVFLGFIYLTGFANGILITPLPGFMLIIAIVFFLT